MIQYRIKSTYCIKSFNKLTIPVKNPPISPAFQIQKCKLSKNALIICIFLINHHINNKETYEHSAIPKDHTATLIVIPFQYKYCSTSAHLLCIKPVLCAPACPACNPLHTPNYITGSKIKAMHI